MISQDLEQLQREVVALIAAGTGASPLIALLTTIGTSVSYANDAAAAAGGVPINGIYRNGNIIQVRIS